MMPFDATNFQTPAPDLTEFRRNPNDGCRWHQSVLECAAMSRAGYTDEGDGDILEFCRWRAQVANAIRGKRGQAFLRELLEALDAMPDKRLISDDLQTINGVCAIGSVGVKRGVDLSTLDPEDPDGIAEAFGIAHQLVCEIEWVNDDVCCWLSDEDRWTRVRAWVVSQIKATP